MIQALRTPEEHFRDLPDFPYSPSRRFISGAPHLAESGEE